MATIKIKFKDNITYPASNTNYAILGNQLVKQGGSGGINKLKLGTETPSKIYMGENEVTKAYIGETLVYEK